MNSEVLRYTGGTNYAKAILKCLINSNKLEKAKWILYIPEGFIILDVEEIFSIIGTLKEDMQKQLMTVMLLEWMFFSFHKLMGISLTTILRIKKNIVSLRFSATSS